MSWIKRNLSLVISGVIALGLLGLGGYYLWSAIQKNNDADTAIGQTKSDIERYLTADPSPNQSNLANAKRELDRLNIFIAEAKRQFPPSPPPPEPLNNETFKSLLETTVNDLHKEAASVGTRLETNYYFTFESQRLPVTFPPESLRPLTERLQEVHVLASILIKARVNRLEHIRRGMVPGERAQAAQPAAGAAGDYLNAGPRTNSETSMVLWPYEMTFRCFSPELGAVLEALERQPGFIVRAPSIEPADEIKDTRPRQQQPPPKNAPPPPPLATVVNERLLRVTLRMEIIKPLPPGSTPGGPGSGRPGRPGGGRP
jgi:hypothetical protein